MSSPEVPASSGLPPSWRVHLPMFEGPLDLLLHLIKINEVDIGDIPVAVICDQFHEYLGLMEELNLDIAGEYVYEAALLIHLKSRMLLPRRPVEDGGEGEDPRQELVERLLEYRRIKEAAQTLAETHRVRQGIWTRQSDLREIRQTDDEETFDMGEVSVFDLLGALRDVLVRYDREHPDPYLLEPAAFSVREQIDRLLQNLQAGLPYDLLDDLRGRRARGEVVAAFLAVLELARLRLIRLHQTDKGDVLLYRTTRELEREDLEGIPG